MGVDLSHFKWKKYCTNLNVIFHLPNFYLNLHLIAHNSTQNVLTLRVHLHVCCYAIDTLHPVHKHHWILKMFDLVLDTVSNHSLLIDKKLTLNHLLSVCFHSQILIVKSLLCLDSNITVKHLLFTWPYFVRPPSCIYSLDLILVICHIMFITKYLQWYHISFVEPCSNFSIQFPMNRVIK